MLLAFAGTPKLSLAVENYGTLVKTISASKSPVLKPSSVLLLCEFYNNRRGVCANSLRRRQAIRPTVCTAPRLFDNRRGRRPLQHTHGCSITVSRNLIVFCKAKNFHHSSFPGFPAKPQVLWGGLPGFPAKPQVLWGGLPGFPENALRFWGGFRIHHSSFY